MLLTSTFLCMQHAAGALHACLHGHHLYRSLICTKLEGRRKWCKGSPSHPGAMCSCSACASRVTRRSSASSRIVTTLAMRRSRNLRGFYMHDCNQCLKFQWCTDWTGPCKSKEAQRTLVVQNASICSMDEGTGTCTATIVVSSICRGTGLVSSSAP